MKLTNSSNVVETQTVNFLKRLLAPVIVPDISSFSFDGTIAVHKGSCSHSPSRTPTLVYWISSLKLVLKGNELLGTFDGDTHTVYSFSTVMVPHD